MNHNHKVHRVEYWYRSFTETCVPLQTLKSTLEIKQVLLYSCISKRVDCFINKVVLNCYCSISVCLCLVSYT